MMKKITLLCILLAMSFGYAQTLASYTFDDAAAITGWNGVANAAGADDSGTNPEASLAYNATGNGTGALEISGVNSEAGIGKAFIFELLNTGFDYQGSGSINISFDVKFDGVYQSAAFHLSTETPGLGVTNFFDLQGGINGSTWTNLNYDVSSISNANTTLKISFQIAAGAVIDAGGTVLIDNIVITGTPATCSDGVQNGDETDVDCGGTTCDACLPPGPQTAAPTPPARAATDVVAVYSDAYPTSSIDPINYDQGWCGLPGIEGTTADGDPVIKFIGGTGDCQGIGFESDLQDLTSFTHIHVDLFIKANTNLIGKVFNMKIVPSVGAESLFLSIDINGLSPAVTTGTWYSFDAPITFSGPTVDIKQMGITSNLQNVVWYDNLYFHKNTVLSTEDFDKTSFSAYPNPTNDNWTVKTSNERISSIQVYDILGKQVMTLNPNAAEVKIDATKLSKGLYFATIRTEAGSESLKLIKN
jgi:endoglucanase